MLQLINVNYPLPTLHPRHDTLIAMTRLYFVRHGESEMNTRQDLVGGRSNHVNLTEKGIRQAKAFGRWLADSPTQPDIVFSSPANRAIQTMDYSLEAANIDLECCLDKRIQELSQGIYEGTARADLYTKETLAQIHQEALDFKVTDGESIHDVMQRMVDFVDDISTKHPRSNVLVYSHGFAIRCLAGALNPKLSHSEIVSGIKTPNLSMSSFRVVANTKSILALGRRVIDEESV